MRTLISSFSRPDGRWSLIGRAVLLAVLTTHPAAVRADDGPPSIALNGNPNFYQADGMTVAGPGDPALYRAQFYGPLSLVVSGLAPGRYTLVLGEAELGLDAVGYRTFSVQVNGAKTAADVDLVKQFGFAKQGDLQLPAEAVDGKITVDLIAGAKNVPCLSFLRVVDGTGKVVAEKDAVSSRPADWNLNHLIGLWPYTKVGAEPTAPPFSGTYKIHPEQKDRLTAADIVGPDGIVYPDWTRAGIAGGIPVLPATENLADFGAKGTDNSDAAPALQTALDQLAAKGGGVLTIGPGTYYLDRPVFSFVSHVVVRGAGKDQTKLVFRYNALDAGPYFPYPKPGATVTTSSWVEADADPRNLKDMVVSADGHELGKLPQVKGEPAFAVRVRGLALAKALGDGLHTLQAVATYADGTTKTGTLAITVDSKAPAALVRAPTYLGVGALNFYGGAPVLTPDHLLAADAHRGENFLLLAPGHGLQAGDKIVLLAPASPRWNALVQNACKGGHYRMNEYEVTSVDGNRIGLAQPLRLDFPVIDGSYVSKFDPVVNCGVEDLTLEQPRDIWTNGFLFRDAWQCWARGVRVNKAGRHPILMTPGKFCEIRDCAINDAWQHGGGGTGYVGYEEGFDCLMENVTTTQMRHGPALNWACSGDVVRNCTFHDSDAQWHAGWTNENLIENCVIESKLGTGCYGFGGWASPPEDTSHGPEGPRNVVYNCDFSSVLVGLSFGGMNEGWIVAYNRFVVDKGPAIAGRLASFDHIIRGNVFCLRTPVPWAIYLASRDCIGLEVSSNRIYGAPALMGGAAPAAVDSDNQFLPFAVADRPQPPVPSIYAWERDHAKSP